MPIIEAIKLFVRRLMMGKGSGILKIPPKKDVNKFAKDLLKKFKEHGVSDSAVNNPKDVKIIWEQITQKEAQGLRNNMEDLLKEMDAPLTSKKSGKGKVFDLSGKRIDTSKPIMGGKNIEATPQDKIDWLVKNVDPNAEQTIPPRGALEAMLRDGREDLIDHFYKMHTKELGKPKINIDTSGLKHPELVKKMMTDEKFKPTLFRDSPERIAQLKARNKAAVERLRKKKMEERSLEDFTDDFTDDPEGLASGGMARVALGGGKLVFEGLKKFLQNKKTVRKAVDDIFPTGDYKYDAEMAAEALVENNPKFFKNKLYDDLSDADRMDVYGSVLSEVQNDLAKMLETRRLSKPTKTLEGLKKEGTIDISDPEVADEFSRFMKESDPKGFKDFEQKVDLSNLDIKGKKGHASGGIAGQLHLNEGGRVPMIFGGSAGLKALIASIKAGLNKGRPEKIKTLFPKYSAADREILKLGEKYLPKDSTTMAAREIEAKAEGIQVLIDRLKHDKKLIAEQVKNKAKNDPSLDFLMESLETTMPEAYGPHLKKYTNIDKDILQLETIKKNLIMKDRKLHASGGIAGQLHLNQGGRVSFTKGGKVSSGLANILGV